MLSSEITCGPSRAWPLSKITPPRDRTPSRWNSCAFGRISIKFITNNIINDITRESIFKSVSFPPLLWCKMRIVLSLITSAMFQHHWNPGLKLVDPIRRKKSLLYIWLGRRNSSGAPLYATLQPQLHFTLAQPPPKLVQKSTPRSTTLRSSALLCAAIPALHCPI